MGFSMFTGGNKIYFELSVSQIYGRSSLTLVFDAHDRKNIKIPAEKREKNMPFISPFKETPGFK